MDNKTCAIIVVAIVAIAAAGAAFLFMGHGDDKEEMDYSIIDDPTESIKLRLAIHVVTPNLDTLAKVSDVTDGKVTYSQRVTLSLIDADEETVEKYTDSLPFKEDLQENIIPFDYTDSSKHPKGISVDASTGKFVIDGSSSIDLLGSKIEMKYENFSFAVVDGKPTSVEGKFSVSATLLKMTFSISCAFEDVDGKMHVKELYLRADTNEHKTVEDFKDKFFKEFDAADYTGCEITDGEPEKYFGKECSVKVVNGNGPHGKTYSDYRILTYNGYILKQTGLVNGSEDNFSVRYFYV